MFLSSITSFIRFIVNFPLYSLSLIIHASFHTPSEFKIKKAQIATPSPEKPGNVIECPYDYILDVYGSGHFANLVNHLDENLKTRDPVLYELILEVMDAVHFGAILVDDVADHSELRKGKPAAHHIYGEAETINRAYLRIFEVIGRCQAARPSIVPFILANLTEVHKGQDDSLVWRRDGFDLCFDQAEALRIYRHCAWLKTGALFRLVGQLVTGGHEKDALLSDFGWYCHLQNDCKNVFSSDVVAAKGALAEDLANGEYSFPILVALHASTPTRMAVLSALRKSGGSGRRNDAAIQAAIGVLHTHEVRGKCLAELDQLRERNNVLASLWGRKEKMRVEA